MSDMRKLLESMNKFAGQEVGQKPGDQVRGTEKATKKKSSEHPFAGRLVGASESKSLLVDLEKQIVEGAEERTLAEQFAKFKEAEEYCDACDSVISKKPHVCPGTENVEEGDTTELAGNNGWYVLDIRHRKIIANDVSRERAIQIAKNTPGTSVWLTRNGYFTNASGSVSYPSRGWIDVSEGVAEGLPRASHYDENPRPIQDDMAVEVWGYAYNNRDQRVMWRKEFSSEQAAQRWADSKNATVMGMKPARQAMEEVSNPTDTVTMDVPLMIRMFEYAREDAKTDMDLHNIADRMIELSKEGRTLTMNDYETICPATQPTESRYSDIELAVMEGGHELVKENSEEQFGYKNLKHTVARARQRFPLAKTDVEALILYVQDKEANDVDALDRVNDREDAQIAQLDQEEDSIEQKLVNLAAQIKGLESLLTARKVKEEVAPAVATAGGVAGANQPKQTPTGQPVDPAAAALQKQNQAKLQQNLANLKTAGVQIDPAKAAQTLQKTDTGAPMNAMDKDTIAQMAPAIGNVMANPSTATQLNTLIKKAGGGA